MNEMKIRDEKVIPPTLLPSLPSFRWVECDIDFFSL
jgi:hypothetical protein